MSVRSSSIIQGRQLVWLSKILLEEPWGHGHGWPHHLGHWHAGMSTIQFRHCLSMYVPIYLSQALMLLLDSSIPVPMYTHWSRVIYYDRVLNEKNNFEIPAYFMFE